MTNEQLLKLKQESNLKWIKSKVEDLLTYSKNRNFTKLDIDQLKFYINRFERDDAQIEKELTLLNVK